MRTTVDLPENLHRQVISLARDISRSLNQVVMELVLPLAFLILCSQKCIPVGNRDARKPRNAEGLSEGASGEMTIDSETGFPVVSVGRVITTEDVRMLEDDVD